VTWATRSSALRVLPGWAAVALLLVEFETPWWVRLPVVGLFSLLGVGLAVVLVLRISQPAIAIAITISVGFSSLIVASLVPLLLFGASALGTLAIQSMVVWVLAAGALRDEWRMGTA